jgi:hypothetical protein
MMVRPAPEVLHALAQGQVEDEPQGQHQLNRQV